jgi:hypothetical protein
MAAVTALLLAAWLEPDPRGFGTHTQLGLAPCGYLVQTGRPCLSCGLTTAYAEMIRGRPMAAFRANPMGGVLFFVTAAAPFWFLHSLVTRRDPFRFTSHRLGRWFLPALAVMLVGCWIGRTL